MENWKIGFTFLVRKSDGENIDSASRCDHAVKQPLVSRRWHDMHRNLAQHGVSCCDSQWGYQWLDEEKWGWSVVTRFMALGWRPSKRVPWSWLIISCARHHQLPAFLFLWITSGEMQRTQENERMRNGKGGMKGLFVEPCAAWNASHYEDGFTEEGRKHQCVLTYRMVLLWKGLGNFNLRRVKLIRTYHRKKLKRGAPLCLCSSLCAIH